MIKEAVQQSGMFNIIHLKSVFKVDFIIRKNDLYRVEEFKRKRQVTVGDVNLFITAPEDLILSKLYWARESLSELQLRDVTNLLSQVGDLDHAYLERWAEYLGITELYKRALS